MIMPHGVKLPQKCHEVFSKISFGFLRSNIKIHSLQTAQT